MPTAASSRYVKPRCAQDPDAAGRVAQSCPRLLRAVDPDPGANGRDHRSRRAIGAGRIHQARPARQRYSIQRVSSFAFVFFYAFLGLPIARLADRHSRRLIIGIGIAFWSVMTALSGIAQSYVPVSYTHLRAHET